MHSADSPLAGRVRIFALGRSRCSYDTLRSAMYISQRLGTHMYNPRVVYCSSMCAFPWNGVAEVTDRCHMLMYPMPSQQSRVKIMHEILRFGTSRMWQRSTVSPTPRDKIGAHHTGNRTPQLSHSRVTGAELYAQISPRSGLSHTKI